MFELSVTTTSYNNLSKKAEEKHTYQTEVEAYFCSEATVHLFSAQNFI